MAFSKIVMNGETLMDLTQDTVAADKLVKDYTAHKNDGTAVTGILETDVPTDGDVIFIDYDGTIVNAKTKAQINAMTSDSDLPANPTHSGLTSQGWNWTVAQLKAQLTAMPDQKIYVGQMYVTTSGATEIDVEMTAGRLSPIMAIAVNGTVSIDWGDETTANTVTGTSLTTRQDVPHTYTSSGNYTIKVSATSGSKYTFYCDSSRPILRKNTSESENKAYTYCVKNARIGNGIEEIYRYAFYYSGIVSITIPNTITSIDSYAFRYAYSLVSITFPSGVTDTGVQAFNSCYGLKSVSLPSTITTVETQSFGSAYSLEKVSLPSGLNNIKSNAFSYCYALHGIKIPNTVTSIGSNAFQYCYNIDTITFPNGVTGTGDKIFQGCANLRNITIANYVSAITVSEFSGCMFTSIIIPSSIEYIYNSAFSGCQAAAEYHVLSTTPPTLGTTVFYNIPSDCIIYVPRGYLNTYKTATGWADYATYMQEEPTT